MPAHNMDDETNVSEFVKRRILFRRKRETNTEQSANNSSSAGPRVAEQSTDIRAKKKVSAKRNSRRLIFKNRKSGIAHKDKDDGSIKVSEGNEDECSSDVMQNYRKKRSSRPLEIHHYTSNIDGYPFIAFHKKEIPVEASVCTPISDAGEDDENETEDSNYSACEEQNNDMYDYSKYVNLWESLGNGTFYGYVPLPVGTDDIEDVNEANVRDFVKTILNAKCERVRWHPDRMKVVLNNTLKWDACMEKDVTHVFQVVNSVYENW